MYTPVCRYVYHPLLDQMKQVPFTATLREAVRNAQLPEDELRRLQTEKLRRILAHASAHTAYYREKFAAFGVSAASVSSTADLQRFPRLTKNDVFQHRTRMMSARYPGKLFSGSTSGSTGIAMRFHFDSDHAAWVDACQWRGRHWRGLVRGDRTLVLWSRPVEGSRVVELKTWAKYRLRNCIQFDAFKEFDDAKVSEVLQAVRAARPKLFYGYGSSMARFAEGVARLGTALAPSERPLLVEYTADHMYEKEKQLASKVFGAPVATAYGSSECGGVAQECREGRLHVSVDHMVVEFLRPDGTPAGEGETAEIVLTTLNNQAMPLIRFHVGDLGSYSTQPCPCGIRLPVMVFQTGKAVDLITTSQKTSISAHVFDYINIHLIKHDLRGIKQFFAEQTGVDDFVVSFVREAPFDERSVQVFVEKMKEYFGQGIVVGTKFVDQIPLQPTGKRRYFKKSFGEAHDR